MRAGPGGRRLNRPAPPDPSARLRVRIEATRGGTAFDLVLDAPLTGTTVLFGPSGAGKSSLLDAVAGLWRPPGAALALGATVLQEGRRFLPPERRGFGLVRQDSLLFPHLGVAANLRYGERRAGSRPPIGLDFDAVSSLLGIAHLLDRRPATLSGGERQRVAIGRALLARPAMLLMDEPLASLDRARRLEILACLRRLRASVGLPILYVTHAADEVASLADTLALVEGGRVLACGPAAEIAASIRLPLARGPDAAALLAARVASHDPDRGLTRLDCGGGIALLVPLRDEPPGRRLRLRIPAREVILAAGPPGRVSPNNRLDAIVAELADADAHEALVRLALAPPPGRPDAAPPPTLIARVTRDATRRLALAPGAPVTALVKSTSIEVLPD